MNDELTTRQEEAKPFYFKATRPVTPAELKKARAQMNKELRIIHDEQAKESVAFWNSRNR